MKTIIVGGGHVGRALAERLEERGEFVVVIEEDGERVEEARDAGLTVHPGDGTARDVLEDAGADDAKTVVAATGDDNDNLLAAQHANQFGVDKVIARVNDPDNLDAFESLDVRAIDAALATAWTIDNEIERPALSRWINRSDGHDVLEIEVTSGDLSGKMVREIDAEIPDSCIIVEAEHDGETYVPGADDVVERGDSITVLGRDKDVREAVRLLHPRDF